jgi:hypothetical protein
MMEVNDRPSVNAPFVKRRIRNFLLDRRFQLAWVARVVLVTALIIGAMGFFLFRTLSESTAMMITQTLALEGLTAEAQQRIIDQGEHDKWVTFATLVAGLFGLLVLLAGTTIVATHKIAGPAAKMSKLLSKIDGNHLQLWAKLRKGDELHETFREFEEMLRRLRESRHGEIEELEAVVGALRAAGHDPASVAKLEELISRYRDSVEMR